MWFKVFICSPLATGPYASKRRKSSLNSIGSSFISQGPSHTSILVGCTHKPWLEPQRRHQWLSELLQNNHKLIKSKWIELLYFKMSFLPTSWVQKQNTVSATQSKYENIASCSLEVGNQRFSGLYPCKTVRIGPHGGGGGRYSSIPRMKQT